MILKILISPLAAYMLTLPVIVVLHSVMGREWIGNTLNNSAFGVWIVLTAFLIVAIIVQYFIKGK